jgi:signal transduction histidine kinase
LGTYLRIIGSQDDYRSCNAEDLLAAALISISDAVRESGAVVTSDPLPEVVCDPSQVVFLFASLMDNSIKFRQSPAPDIHVSAFPDEREWVISVQDNGIGIEPRHADLVFAMFRRVHGGAYTGAGVGLAIARQIVSRHGGRIWFESEPGRGSRFSFTLPKAA